MNIPANDLEQALAALNIPQSAGAVWRESWAASQATFDPDKLNFLKPDFVANICRTLGMSAEVRDALLRALDLFDRSPGLQRLAWHCHILCCGMPGADPRPTEWPKIPRDQGEPATLFYALIALAGVPGLVQQHCDQGIPESVTLDTMGDIELWIKEHRTRYGMFGLDQLGWLANHLSGRLYKLGRLQFNFETWEFDFHVFRNRTTRRVLMLAGDRQPFRADGQFGTADGAADAVPGWVSVLCQPQPTLIRGNPVSPNGRVLPNLVQLSPAEWELIFKRGDPALGVHIPATGPMAHGECGESFRQACRFFPAHFPDRPWRAFTCNSWLLDPQFERRLPEASNIVRFQREMYLFPLPRANAGQHFERVFGKQYENLPPEQIDSAPQNTSLQRVLVQHIKSGGRWRSGGSVLFPEDLDWGAQVYRNKLRVDFAGLTAQGASR